MWGRGSPGYTYPPDIGFPIGGRNSNPYMKLVIHFANPNQMTGMICVVYCKAIEMWILKH